MAERGSQGIGSIGLGRAREAKQLGDHVLHLRFIRRAGTHHRLLDLPGSILMHLHISMNSGHYGGAAGLPQLQRRIRITREKHLLNTEYFWLVLAYQLGQAFKDQLQSFREGSPARRMQPEVTYSHLPARSLTIP